MTFPLAGLLRVRGAQERMAAEELSRAGAARAAAEAAEQDAVTGLAQIGDRIDDAATLLAMAAARASGRSALADLQTLSALRRAEELEARTAHVEARRELKGLERLEDAHRTEAAAAELRSEQMTLDEIAVARSRGDGSAA